MKSGFRGSRKCLRFSSRRVGDKCSYLGQQHQGIGTCLSLKAATISEVQHADSW